MRSPVTLGNIVREAEDVLLIRIVPLHCKLDSGAVALGDDEEHAWMDRGLVAVQMLDEGANPSSVLEDVLLARTFIEQLDPYTRIEERQLAKSLGENVVVKFDIGEGIGARTKVNDGTAPCRLPSDFQFGFGIAVTINLPESTTVAMNGELEALGQSVDNGDAHPVEAAGDLV